MPTADWVNSEDVPRHHAVSNRVKAWHGRDFQADVIRRMMEAGIEGIIVGKKHGHWQDEADALVNTGARVLAVHAKRTLRERWTQADHATIGLQSYYGKVGFVSVLVSNEPKPPLARPKTGMLFMTPDEFEVFLASWVAEGRA